jgi:PIF1-like helicase
MDGLEFFCRNEARPSTPEGERARIRAADHLERLQMTNPDERRSRIRVSTSTESEGIIPLNFGASLAAQIPEVQMPADWNAPRQFPLPVAPAPMERIGAIFGNPVGVSPFAPMEQTSIIIWDEVPMQHKYATDAVDRTLRDLKKILCPFSGITILFGGDFRQTLPVIPRGSREQVIAASIRRSTLWRHITIHHLHHNMWLDRTPENDAHAAWLLEIGAGSTVDAGDTIEIPQTMLCQENTMQALIEATYPEIDQGNHSDQYYLDRTILSCTNDSVDDINSLLLSSYPGPVQVFNSAEIQLRSKSSSWMTTSHILQSISTLFAQVDFLFLNFNSRQGALLCCYEIWMCQWDFAMEHG